MINWKKYFDHIYCIHSTFYPERLEKIKNELQRVNILDSGIFSWKISSGDFVQYIKYNDVNYIYNPDDPNKNKLIDLCKNYAEIFEDTIINDYQKILILEDDIYFLKDLNLVKTILDNCPDFDICKFDWNCFFTWLNQDIDQPNTIYHVGNINDYYCYYTWTTSTGITGYSNRICQYLLGKMKYFLYCNCMIPFDNVIARLCDDPIFLQYADTNEEFLMQFNNPDVIKTVLSKKHIAMQMCYEYYMPSDYELADKFGEMYRINKDEYNFSE